MISRRQFNLLMAGMGQPADGVMVERPQRSEDERPWGRQGLAQDGRRRDGMLGRPP